jgi:plasmid rolling circle replication initiator protein Rep
MKTKKSQEVEKNSSMLKEKNWALHKLSNKYVSVAYEDIDERKAERMRGCCPWIEFKKLGDVMKLHKAFFCKVRLCAVCQWRRSLKAFRQMSRILVKAREKYNSQFLFLTLTVKNCEGYELGGTLDDLMEGFNRLMKYKEVKQAVKGYYRGTEITHDVNEFITGLMWYGRRDPNNPDKRIGGRAGYYKKLGLKKGDINPNFDKYHPHFHCVLAVNPSYFTDKTYISQKRWIELWKRAMKLDYDPNVDIRRCTSKPDGTAMEQIATELSAIAEVCKYAVKPGDIVNVNDWELTVDTVRLLDSVLEKRRFIGLGGIFDEIHKELKLDDIENGDLELKENEREIEDYDIVRFTWNGYNQYEIG